MGIIVATAVCRLSVAGKGILLKRDRGRSFRCGDAVILAVFFDADGVLIDHSDSSGGVLFEYTVLAMWAFVNMLGFEF